LFVVGVLYAQEKNMARRGSRDSSVSDDEYDHRRSRDRSDAHHDTKRDASMDRPGISNSTAIPDLGMIVRGKVSSIAKFGAFVAVEGYTDGLVHVTRMDEKGRRMYTQNDIRKNMKEGDEIYAKVYLVREDKYSLDYRFVDQETGEDLDPKNERRDALENAAEERDKYGDRNFTVPPVNEIFAARIHSTTVFGCFVDLVDSDGKSLAFKHGLLPRGKTLVRNPRDKNDVLTTESRIEDHYRAGDPLFVKVVDVQGQKYNCDMRYVDQITGKDLDPSNEHSNEKTFGNARKSRDNSPVSNRRYRSPAGGRRQSRSPVSRRDRDRSPDAPRAAHRGRDRSPPVNRRDRSPRGRSYSPERRRYRSRSPDDRRRRDRSPEEKKGFSFYSTENSTNGGDVVRRRR